MAFASLDKYRLPCHRKSRYAFPTRITRMRIVHKERGPHPAARPFWRGLASRLTPQEQKAVLLIAGLFVLGAAVRWLRDTLTH